MGIYPIGSFKVLPHNRRLRTLRARAIKKFKSWKEQVRGVDEATKTRRERARRRTLRRLNKYPQDISEQQRAQMRDELEERKTLLRENAGSSTETSG